MTGSLRVWAIARLTDGAARCHPSCARRPAADENQARQGHEEMVQLVWTLENVDPARTQARLDDLP